MTIQWFPGHMTKARRMMEENLKLVDMVIELRDCRIPYSSKNPMLDQVILSKPRLIVLSKKDKGETNVTNLWIETLSNDTTAVIAADLLHDSFIQKLASVCQSMMKEKIERQIRRGIRPRAIRAMVVGVPNVGKSTMINRVAGKHIAQTADRPGVTRALQWVKLNRELELLDTPGVLWPKFEDPMVGFHLALTGAIKDEILPKEELAVYAINWLKNNEPEKLKERYSLTTLGEDPYLILDELAFSRKFLNKQGEPDRKRAMDTLISEIRNDRLGVISWERPQ